MNTTTKVLIGGAVVVGGILLLRKFAAASTSGHPGAVLTEIVVARDANGCGCFQHRHDATNGTLSVDRVANSQCDSDPELRDQLSLCIAGDIDTLDALVPVDTGGFPVGDLRLPAIVTAFGQGLKDTFGKLFS